MSNVALDIGGRSFTVACADGEEHHVTKLGRMIDGKLAEMGDTAGQSESRLLLFAALLLADDLHEAGQRQPAADLPRLEAMAMRLENLASRLEA
ncbi:MAG: cell division protein ZapA [Novosphingobium sp.]